MFETFLIVFIPIYVLLITQLDRIYPKNLFNFLIYYAWALSFCNFLFVMISLYSQILNVNYIIKFLGNIYNLFSINSNLIILYKSSILENFLIFKNINFGIWFSSSWLHIDWIFTFDLYELIMLIIVTLISSMVQLYSINYMIFDNYKKFVSYITFFTFFMILLVSAGNFLILFVGWEGVGLCSYLLINFWNTRINANLAAMKALIINRVADMALTVGIIIIAIISCTLNFEQVFPLVTFFLDETFIVLSYELNMLSLISILLFIGAMGKSAQLGLHTWLPDAMEGPTPVSALIHAATMVTAGVFLLIKCSPILENVPLTLNIILFIGSFTAFFSALIGLLQNDIKKIIAYSTCSQLGYMIFCCGLSAYDISFFHLINHAFFKALLFLSAGSLIHSLANEQDLRKYGISIKMAPFISTMFIIGSLALVGFPFLTGFYSKDMILEVAFTKYTITAAFAYILGVFTAFLTAIYSFKIIYLTFIFEKDIYRRFLSYDTSLFLHIPLILLAVGSYSFGYKFKDLFLGMGSDALIPTIAILPINNTIIEAELYGWLPGSAWWFKLIPLVIIQMAIITVVALNKNTWIFYQKSNILHLVLIKKFFFDILNNKILVQKIFIYASYDYIYKCYDKILLELCGPYNIAKMILVLSYSVRKIHSGIIFIYTIYIFITIFIFLSIPLTYLHLFLLIS